MKLLSSFFHRCAALVLLLATGLQAWAGNEDFLPPEQAFALSTRVLDGHSVELKFDVAEGYYLYRERLKIEVRPAVGALQVELPAGKVKFDENFQKEVEVYRHDLTLRVALPQATQPFTLSVTSQGCADRGLCYQPITRDWQVAVQGGEVRSISAVDAGQASPAPVSVSEQTPPQPDKAGAEKAAGEKGALQSGNLLLIAGAFGLAGLLLSFTPCVLPMLPILSSIIVGQGQPVSRSRGFMLAVSYSLGMALVYTAMGVAAGLAGEGLAAALQNPWVLGAFALMLAGFSLSMFGVYQLQLPASLQAKASETSGRFQGGRVLGVFAMGGVSALIVGPCVAAPLAGALVYISQTRDVLVGAVALFSLACGMSVPLLLVGLSAGSLLPRAGGWMEHVKHAFGVMLLAVAIWMVSPVLPGWVLMALVGTLLVITAVYLGAFERLPDTRGWPRLFKGVGVLFALVGSVQFVGVLSGGRDVLQPLSHLAQRKAGAEQGVTVAQQHDGLNFKRVGTVAELEAAVAAAGKPVMLDFYADWCVSCKEYEKFTFRDARVQDRLRDVVLLQADVTANSAHDKELLKRFQLFGPPGLVFFDAQGREQSHARVVGYQPGDQFLGSLKAAAL
jgi:thioredoxin:protein disulfide reductase